LSFSFAYLSLIKLVISKCNVQSNEMNCSRNFGSVVDLIELGAKVLVLTIHLPWDAIPVHVHHFYAGVLFH